MDTHSISGRLVVAADPRLYAHLQRLARAQRLVFFAGLPGTGKSLLSHQLAHLAHAVGRTVHLLQWDVARPRCSKPVLPGSAIPWCTASPTA